MRNFILFLSLIISFTPINAQQLDLNAPIPSNDKVTKGVLENGMTYYIYPTDVVKNAATYYIIQNVGSILENDNQKGLAHFLEHMAFNGTKNFDGKGILNTLQKHGAVFGKDINAYTSFDETVYNLNNIPTNVDGLVDTALLILHDWADALLLTDEEIDAERGVIKEEWRTRQSGSWRIFVNSAPTVFNHSKYADRMPIGTMEVVENFDYKTLRDFYNDWYRTDLQAIAIVGDVDVKVIEQKIIQLFSPIKANENPKERFLVEIPDNQEMLYCLGLDKEVSTSSLTFSIYQPKSLKDRTVRDLRESFLNNMISSMLSNRLREISDKPDAPFTGASAGYRGLAKLKNEFALRISPKKGQQAAAFKTVMEELNRAVKFGFTQEEINRLLAQYDNSYQIQISKIEDMPHRQIISSIQNNFLENETMSDIVKEYEIAKELFKGFTPAVLHDHIQKLYTPNNRVLNVTGVETETNLTLDDAKKIISEAENNSSLTAYTDAFSGKTLMGNLEVKPGKIVSEKQNETIGSTTFELSNGIKVHYKFVNKERNTVNLSAFSWGGTSLLKDKDLPSAENMSSLVRMSGIGEYKSTDLSKILAGKSASLSVNLNGLSEEMNGRAVTKDVETMLQLVHLQFVKPRFDQESYKVLINNLQSNLLRRAKNINAKMSDSISVTLYGKYNPKIRLFDESYIKDVSFERMKELFNERFNNPADFEFFIVGDVQTTELKPLLEKYIAGISTTTSKEQWKDNSVEWIQKKTDKDIFLEMEDPKGTVMIEIKNNTSYNQKNKLYIKALKDILTLRLTETLREQEGGTYGAGVSSYLNKRPSQVGSLSISFDCDPKKADKLVAIVYQEIEKIKKGEIQENDVVKTRTNYLKELNEEKEFNKYDMNLLFNYFVEGVDLSSPKNSKDIIESMTAKDIQKFTKKLIKNSQSFEIVFKPKNKS